MPARRNGTVGDLITVVFGRWAALIPLATLAGILGNVSYHMSERRNALRDVVVRFRRAGTRVILSDVHAQPMLALQRSSLADELPDDALVGNIDDALNAARAHLGLAPVPHAAFAVPTVAREDRRREPRPPG